ncbi:hypothetical protein [Geobacter sp. AOG2]|uniref:hypothetical protein n=1 Tax=Geobacter sp. AOG2 TaxID=1566347 RepID=UPI001CC3A7BE|nr:hypothetical protein [Geobacter sp. AOG2]GFE59740.1 histidine kinase [Geobacter sp. AOG2]
MKRSRILAVLAVLGLTAAAAVPAMALENEFHGMFGARYDNSNFNGTKTTDFNAAGGAQYDPTGTTKNVYSANYVEQRARLQYIAKANADLKLVTHFELDYTYWGNSSYTVGRNQGGALGADTVNIETKNIYLDANIFKNVNMKLGMMPNNDAFKGVLFDADMAGLLLSSSYGKFSPSIGYFRFNDKGGSVDQVLGHKTNDMFMLDGKFEVTKDLKVGAAYYFFRDNQVTGSTTDTTFGAGDTILGYLPDGTAVHSTQPTTTTTVNSNDVKIHALGLNAEYGMGPLTLNGFAIYETGWNNVVSGKKTYVNAFAGNVGAKLKAGPGTAHAEFLYVSGSSADGKNAFYAVDGEHGYYDNEMVILGRDKNAFFTIDNSIIYNSGNSGQGQIGGYIGYELPVSDRLTTACNAGFAAVAKDTAGTHKSNYLGTELNAEANYKLFENLTAGVRVAYVILGDYYKDQATNGTPVNPYDASLIIKYAF